MIWSQVFWIFPRAPEPMHLLDPIGQIGIGLTGTLDVAMLRRRKATGARISRAGMFVPLALGLVVGCQLAHWISGGAAGKRFLFAGPTAECRRTTAGQTVSWTHCLPVSSV